MVTVGTAAKPLHAPVLPFGQPLAAVPAPLQPERLPGRHRALLSCLGLAAAAALPRPRRRTAARASRVGCVAPEDPILQDRAQFGRGHFCHADWCRAFRNAVPCQPVTCELEGEVPAGLAGRLFRNGPGRFERGGDGYRHFLDGDGFVHSWDLGEGLVRYSGDFVRTPDYEAEEAAGKILFRGAFGTEKPGGLLANAFDVRLKNLVNTNVLAWGGKLLALYEAAHPCRLRPDLAFAGEEDLDGLLRPGMAASSGQGLVDAALGMGGSAFTAHPKLDPLKRLLVGFAWASKDGGVDLRVQEWDEDFRRVCSAEVSLPSCDAQPHDFGLTESRYVFFENRLKMSGTSDFLLGLKGAVECLEAQPKLPQRIHVVPRAGGEAGGATLVIQGSCSAFDVHVAHCHDGPPLAWQQEGGADLVTVYTSGWVELPEGAFLGAWGSEDEAWPFEVPPDSPAADFNHVPRTQLLCHVLDLASGAVVHRAVVPGCEAFSMEHPTINCSFTGSRSCRYVYFVVGNECGAATAATPPCGWARADLLTGEVQTWYAGSRTVAEEPHFVPRNGPGGTWSAGAPEGAEDDGWLLAVLFDAEKDRSCLCIFDAARLQEGPVCRAWGPHAVPHGLHGCFVPKD